MYPFLCLPIQRYLFYFLVFNFIFCILWDESLSYLVFAPNSKVGYNYL